MPAVIPVIAAVAATAIKTFVVSQVLAAVLTIAVSIAATLLQSKLSNRRMNQGQELKLKLDPAMPRQVAVGRTATGGSLVWAWTYTDSSKKPNRYLVRIIALSDLPINGVVSVRSGSEVLTFSGDIHTGLRPCNQYRDKKNNASFWLKVVKGSPTATADPTAVAMGGGWTSSHKGTNIAYAIVKADYDPDAFPNGEPTLTFEVDGASVYDARADSTVAGGSGTQRLATPSTWTYSRNAAVITTQILRGFYSNGVLLLGAQAEPEDFLTGNLQQAANVCDEAVTSLDGTIPRYRAGIMLNSEEPVANYLLDMQSAFDGFIADRGGQITLLPGADRTPVFDITDDDIDWSSEKSWQPKAELGSLLNHVVGAYVSETDGYSEKPFPTLRNAQWETDDGGERFSRQLTFRAVTNLSQVQRITQRVHKSSRYQGVVAFVLPMWGLELEQYDTFTWTSARFGFTKKFLARAVDITTDLKIAVVGQEIPDDFEEWNALTDEVARTDTTGDLGSFGLVLPDVAYTAYKDYDATTATENVGVKVVLTNVFSGVEATAFEFRYALQSDLTAAVSVGTVPADNQTFYILNLLPNTPYAFSCRATDGSRFSDWSVWTNVTTPNYTNSMADILADLSVLENSVDELSSDDWLSPSDKAQLFRDREILLNTFAAVKDRAEELTIGTSEIATAQAALDTLDTFLSAITPDWDDFDVQSPVNGGLLRTYFAAATLAVSQVQTLIGGITSSRYDTPPSTLGLGSIWIDPATNDNYAFWGIELTSGGEPLTFGSSTLFGSGLISTQAPTADLALLTAEQADARADQAFGAITQLAADGIITKSEKIQVFIPKSAQLQSAYEALTAAAANLGLTYTSVTAARTAWLDYRNALIPAWDDVTQNTPVVRDDFRDLLNAYDAALEDLNQQVVEAAAVSLTIAPPAITIRGDYLNRVLDSLPVLIAPTLKRGQTIINSSATWSVAASSTLTVTQDTTSTDVNKGKVSITGITGDGTITISAAGKTATCRVTFAREAAPTGGGGGGGGGSGIVSTFQTSYPAVTSTSYPSNPPLVFQSTADSNDELVVIGSWQYTGNGNILAGKLVYRVAGSGGAWIDGFAAITGSEALRYTDDSIPGEYTFVDEPGVWSVDTTISGLTSGVAYEWGMVFRKVGAGNCTPSGTTEVQGV